MHSIKLPNEIIRDAVAGLFVREKDLESTNGESNEYSSVSDPQARATVQIDNLLEDIPIDRRQYIADVETQPVVSHVVEPIRNERALKSVVP